MSTGKKVGMIIGIVVGSIAVLFAAIIVVAIINVSGAADPKLKKADLMELGYIDKDSNLLCVLDGTQNDTGEKNITIPSGGYLPQKADWSNTSSGYVCDRDGVTSHSDEKFDPRSFYGNWSLHKITGPGGQYTCDYRMFIESSGAVRELEILPTKMKFTGSFSDLYTFKRETRSDADISGANCFEMVFHTNPVDEYENIKEITTYGIYDTASDVLAVGFAKVTDEDHIEFTECDYSISWTGFELVLTIDGISACYIPSSMQSYFASGFDKSRSIMWSGYRKLASGYKPIDGFSEIYLSGSEFIKDKNMPALMIQSNVTYGAPYNTTAYKCGVLFYRDGIVRMHVAAKAGSNYSMPEFYENCSYRMSERAIVLIKGGVESLYVTEY